MNKNTKSIRPPRAVNPVSRTAISVVRILIASYFLAIATGLVFDPDSRSLFNSVLIEAYANLAVTVYLYVTAFAIMVGKAVRPAALLLSVFIFWSGFVQYNLGNGAAALAIFWREMALLGAVLLIAAIEPGGSGTFRLFRRAVAPRRVMRAQERITQTTTPRPPKATVEHADIDELDTDGPINIFDGVWESKAQSA